MTSFSGSDGIRWHPVSVIEKYSSSQVRYARSRCEAPWSRRMALPPRAVLTGDLLRMLFREPEGGVVEDQGNGVVTAGMMNLALVLTGSGGHPLAPGRAVFGVGSDPGGFDREQVSLSKVLGEESGRSWYRPMDPGYPWVPRPGVIEGQATFTESEACFAWHEWGWGTGPGKPVPHHSLRGCYGGEQPVMMNRRAHPAGYGTKEAGVAWVFRTEITLGLHTIVSLTG
jgi:hypothetical protein